MKRGDFSGCSICVRWNRLQNRYAKGSLRSEESSEECTQGTIDSLVYEGKLLKPAVMLPPMVPCLVGFGVELGQCWLKGRRRGGAWERSGGP